MAKIWAICLAISVAAWAFVPSLDYLHEVSEAMRHAQFFLKNDREPLTKFVFKIGDNPGFRWVNDHEFWHGGEIFDLKKTENRGDSLYVFARKDEHEKKIHESFSDGLAHEKKGQNTAGHLFWKNWLNFPFDLPATIFLTKTGFFLPKISKSSAKRGFSAVVCPPPSPPPEAIS